MKPACVMRVLTCLVAVHVLSVRGQSTCCPTDSCCVDNCDAPTPYNITLEEAIGLQPFYVSFLPNIPLFAGIDNSCYTFIPLPDGNYLLSMSTVYTNGLSTIDTYIIASNGPGKATYGSASCITDVTLFAPLTEGKTCNVLIFYQCFEYGASKSGKPHRFERRPLECSGCAVVGNRIGCSMQPGNDIPILGLSPLDISIDHHCLLCAEDLIRSSGVPDQEYFALPMKRNTQCVTSIDCSLD